MPSGSLLLLTSAFLHALWNALAKASKDKDSFLFLTILQSGFYPLIIAIAIGTSLTFPNNSALTVAILSGIFEGLYFLTLSQALKTTNLGTSYAIMRGGAMIWVWAFSMMFLGEIPTTLQIVGVCAILLGLLVMNIKDLTIRNLIKENGWSIASSVFIAGYHLCYHQALIEKTDPKAIFSLAMIVSLPFLLYGIRHNTVKRLTTTIKTQGKRVLATGLFATSSFLIFLYGLQVVQPGFAISLRNSSIFFALIFSWILKESLTRAQLMGAATIGIGAVILSIS